MADLPILLPFLTVFKISLAEMARAIPPFTDLMTWADDKLDIALNFANYFQLLTTRFMSMLTFNRCKSPLSQRYVV